MKKLLLFVGLASALGCESKVQHDNPYDPTTPAGQQARGAITGVVDPAKVPGGGIPVNLYDSSGLSTAVAFADAAGGFTFADLVPGTFSLELRADGYLPLTRAGIAVAAGKVVNVGVLSPDVLPGQPEDGALQGVVVLENDAADPPGSPTVVRVDALVGGTASFVAELQVDVDGRAGGTPWAVRVKPGTYRVSARNAAYLPAAVESIKVVPGAASQDVRLDLALNPASLSGIVLRESRDRAAAPEPAAGASIQLDGREVATAGPDGKFTAGHLVAGSHSLSVVLAGYEDSTGPRAVQLTAGVATVLSTPLVVRLERGAVAGTVRTLDDRSLENAVAELAGWDSARVVVDPADPAKGSFVFADVPVGSYKLTVYEDRYRPETKDPVIVTRGQTTAVGELLLAPAVGGFVILGGGESLPGYTANKRVQLQFDEVPQDAKFVRYSEDQNFAGVSFQALDSTKLYDFDLAPAGSPLEGRHYVYAQYSDLATGGTLSQTFSQSVVYDATPPADPSVLIEGGSAYTNKQTGVLVLTLDASDKPVAGVDATSGLARVQISRVGIDASGLLSPEAAFAYERDHLYVLPSGDTGDGAKSFWVQFQDAAGNRSAPGAAAAHARIVLDTAKPTGITFSIDDGPGATAAGYTNTLVVTVRLDAQDASPLAVRLSNDAATVDRAAAQPLTGQVTWLLAAGADGARSVTARVEDAAGNAATDLTRTLTLDRTPPAAGLSVTGLTNGFVNLAAAGVASLSASASDVTSGLAAASVMFSESPTFANATWEAFAPTRAFGLTQRDGPKTVFLRARDKAGNAADASVSMALDTEAPTALLEVGDGSGWSRADSVALTLVSASSDVEAAAVAVDAAPDCATASYAPVGAGLTAGSLSEGPHTVYVCLRDKAGNTAPTGFSGSTLAGGVTVDLTDPSGTVSLDSGATYTTDRDVTVSLTGASADVAQMKVSDASMTCSAVTDWSAYSPARPYRITCAKNLPCPVYVCLRDASGRTSSALTGSIVYDPDPPTVSSVAIVGRAETNSLAGALALDVTGATRMLVSGDLTAAGGTAPGAWIGYSAGPALAYTDSDGLKTVTVVFADDAGNTTAAYTDSVTVDRQAPTGASIALPRKPTTNQLPATLALAAAGATRMCVSGDVAGPCSPATATTTWPSYQPTLAVTLTSGEALKTVSVTFGDEAGNKAAAVSDSTTYDVSAPVPDPTTPLAIQGWRVDAASGLDVASAAVARRNDVALTLRATGATRVAVANSALACNTAAYAVATFVANVATVDPFLLAGGTGTKTVYACFGDDAGNVTSSPVTASIYLDQSAPTGAYFAVAGGADFVTASPVPLTQITASDDYSATGSLFMRFANESGGGPGPWSAWETLGPTRAGWPLSSGEGLKIVYMQVRDWAGNVASSERDGALLDTQAPAAPTVPGISPARLVAGTHYVPSQSPTLSWTASTATDVDRYEVELVSVRTFTVAGTSLTLPSLAEGAYGWRVRALDKAGWPSAWTTQQPFVVDVTVPTAPRFASLTMDRIHLAESATCADDRTYPLALAVQAVDANFDHYEIRGGHTATGTAPCAQASSFASVGTSTSYTFQLAKDRINTLQVRAVDKAGNVSDADFVLVTEDSTAPGIVGSLAVEGADGEALVTWKAPVGDADVAGYRLYYGPLGGTDKALYTGTFAAEGASPLGVGNPCDPSGRCSFKLTGLSNGTPFYVTVAAFDQTQPAPLEGAVAPGERVKPDVIAPVLAKTVAMPGGVAARAVEVQGDKAYVTYGNNVAGSAGLAVVDVSQPDYATIKAQTSSTALQYMWGVKVRGRYAYAADGSLGLRTIDLSDMSVSATHVASGHYKAVEVLGEYVYVVRWSDDLYPTTGGLEIYSLRSGECGSAGPARPGYCGAYQTTFGCTATASIPADLAAQGHHLFVTNGANDQNTILDLTNPKSPTCAGGGMFASDLGWNQGIAVSGRYAVVSYNQGFAISDVFNVANPMPMGKVSGFNNGHLVATAGGYVFFTQGMNNDTSTLYIYDMADVSSPTRVGTYTVTGANQDFETDYVHSGRIAVFGFYAAMANGAGLQVLRLIRPIAPRFEGKYTKVSTAGAASAGTTAGNLAFVSKGNVLEALDITNPAAPAEFGGVTTGWYWSEMVYDSGVVYACKASKDDGVVAYRVGSDGTFDSAGSYTETDLLAYDLAIRWPFLYVWGATTPDYSTYSNAFRVLDVRTTPFTKVAGYDFAVADSTGSMDLVPTSVSLSGQYAYVSAESKGVHVFQVQPALSYVKTLPASTFGGSPSAARVWGGSLYVSLASNPPSMQVYSLADPLDPALTGAIALPMNYGYTGDFAVSGPYVLGAMGDPATMITYDFTAPATPRVTSFIGDDFFPNTVVPLVNHAYVVTDREYLIYRMH